MISIEHRTQIDLNLHRHEVLNLPYPHSGMEVACEQGVIWLTISGDVHDYTLEPGEYYVARDSNPLVIEAVRDAVVNLKDTVEDAAIRVVA